MQREFYYQYYSTLMRICVRYSKNELDAEQWVHDGFIKIFGCLSQYQFLGSFEGWLKKIMVRFCIDQIRAQNRQKNEVENNTVYNDHSYTDNDHFIDNHVLEKFSAEDMTSVINNLPDKQRMVFNLHVFEEYSHKEIAPMLQITENHSYWLLHQARKQLRETLQKQVPKKTLKYEPK